MKDRKVYALATRGWMMYAITVCFAVTGITLPSIQAILGRHTPADRRGELQGSLAGRRFASL